MSVCIIALGTPLDAKPRPWLYFEVPVLLINALEVKDNPRSVLQHDGKLWIDSGGYQIMRKGITIDVYDVIKIYERVNADLYFSLDVPPTPQDPLELARKKFEKSYQNWLKLSKRIEVVPVLHVYKDAKLFLEYLEKYENVPALAIGGAVPYVLTTRGASRQFAFSLIAAARRRFKGKLHVFGLGSPAITPILRALGIDSTDTATWRLKAAYGKVLLPGGGERHVTKREVKFGKKKPKDGELEELYHFLRETGFPLADAFFERLNRFEYRALVNAWVVLRPERPPRPTEFRKLYNTLTNGLEKFIIKAERV
ncbi:MAG: tRNA-ribosyltransferase [Pyrobaculum sp.]